MGHRYAAALFGQRALELCDDKVKGFLLVRGVPSVVGFEVERFWLFRYMVAASVPPEQNKLALRTATKSAGMLQAPSKQTLTLDDIRHAVKGFPAGFKNEVVATAKLSARLESVLLGGVANGEGVLLRPFELRLQELQYLAALIFQLLLQPAMTYH